MRFSIQQIAADINYHLLNTNIFISLDFYQGIPVLEIYKRNNGIESIDDILDRHYPSVVPNPDSIDDEEMEDILHRNAIIMAFVKLILEKYDQREVQGVSQQEDQKE